MCGRTNGFSEQIIVFASRRRSCERGFSISLCRRHSKKLYNGWRVEAERNVSPTTNQKQKYFRVSENTSGKQTVSPMNQKVCRGNAPEINRMGNRYWLFKVKWKAVSVAFALRDEGSRRNSFGERISASDKPENLVLREEALADARRAWLPARDEG